MNDLETQFEELVAHEPGGDADVVFAGATRALARRDRRRRAVLAGGVGVVVLAAVLVAVQVGGNDDSAPIVDETTTTVPLRTIAADDGQIAISMTLPESLVAGERVWAELEVRNIGDKPLWWEAGGSTPPVSATIGEASDGRSAIPAPWSGDPDDLADALIERNWPFAFVEESYTGLQSIARTADSRPTELAPGEVRRHRVSADLRLAPGSPEHVLVSVSATFYDEFGSPPTRRAPISQVEAEGTLPLSPVGSGRSEALDAFAADRRLQRFVDATRFENGGWYADLVWWRDAWELTVTPQFSDDISGESRYRLRWRDGKIIDARRIWWGQAPADDPEGTRFPGAPADDVE